MTLKDKIDQMRDRFSQDESCLSDERYTEELSVNGLPKHLILCDKVIWLQREITYPYIGFTCNEKFVNASDRIVGVDNTYGAWCVFVPEDAVDLWTCVDAVSYGVCDIIEDSPVDDESSLFKFLIKYDSISSHRSVLNYLFETGLLNLSKNIYFSRVATFVNKFRDESVLLGDFLFSVTDVVDLESYRIVDDTVFKGLLGI